MKSPNSSSAFLNCLWFSLQKFLCLQFICISIIFDQKYMRESDDGDESVSSSQYEQEEKQCFMIGEIFRSQKWRRLKKRIEPIYKFIHKLPEQISDLRKDISDSEMNMRGYFEDYQKEDRDEKKYIQILNSSPQPDFEQVRLLKESLNSIFEEKKQILNRVEEEVKDISSCQQKINNYKYLYFDCLFNVLKDIEKAQYERIQQIFQYFTLTKEYSNTIRKTKISEKKDFILIVEEIESDEKENWFHYCSHFHMKRNAGNEILIDELKVEEPKRFKEETLPTKSQKAYQYQYQYQYSTNHNKNKSTINKSKLVEKIGTADPGLLSSQYFVRLRMIQRESYEEYLKYQSILDCDRFKVSKDLGWYQTKSYQFRELMRLTSKFHDRLSAETGAIRQKIVKIEQEQRSLSLLVEENPELKSKIDNMRMQIQKWNSELSKKRQSKQWHQKRNQKYRESNKRILIPYLLDVQKYGFLCTLLEHFGKVPDQHNGKSCIDLHYYTAKDIPAIMKKLRDHFDETLQKPYFFIPLLLITGQGSGKISTEIKDACRNELNYHTIKIRSGTKGVLVQFLMRGQTKEKWEQFKGKKWYQEFKDHEPNAVNDLDEWMNS